MHRVAVIGAGTLDSLPHNGAVVTLLAVCGSTHRESYLDIVMVAIVGAFSRSRRSSCWEAPWGISDDPIVPGGGAGDCPIVRLGFSWSEGLLPWNFSIQGLEKLGFRGPRPYAHANMGEIPSQ